jgi:hypothetical protein
LAVWLVRGVTYCMPALFWDRQEPSFAFAFALFLGLIDGLFRWRVARTARSFVAETDALVISSGLATARVAWSNVLAIEVWHRPNRVDSAAVHYRTTSGYEVATCWEQSHRAELVLFVRRCAAFAKAARPRRTIVRVNLSDRAAYSALLRRLLLDVALAGLAGMLCGTPCHALWLGATAGLLSAALAAIPYLHCATLVRRDGMWWRRRKNGELTRLRSLPRSLRLWV